MNKVYVKSKQALEYEEMMDITLSDREAIIFDGGYSFALIDYGVVGQEIVTPEVCTLCLKKECPYIDNENVFCALMKENCGR